MHYVDILQALDVDKNFYWDILILTLVNIASYANKNGIIKVQKTALFNTWSSYVHKYMYI